MKALLVGMGVLAVLIIIIAAIAGAAGGGSAKERAAGAAGGAMAGAMFSVWQGCGCLLVIGLIGILIAIGRAILG